MQGASALKHSCSVWEKPALLAKNNQTISKDNVT